MGPVSTPRAAGSSGTAHVVFGKKSGLGIVNLDDVALGTGGFKIIGENDQSTAGASVASAGDIDGDGFDDLVIGAYFSDAGGTYSGAAYVLFGQDFTGIVTPGTASDDSLAGSTVNDILVGGQGNDVLDGGAGNDVLRGAAGDDVLVFDAADKLVVDGGSGFDTLRFGAAGKTLNLTTLNDTEHYGLYTSIEAIELTGTGNNILRLDDLDLFHLSDTSNTLRVDGNAGDAVTTTDAGWGADSLGTGDFIGYTIYTNGEATLAVDTDITRTGIQV
ncbi:MAG: hypothetical protein EXQ94_04170 [Alphaproteobacteria bacterium]|nr:hypothetical protein [Alphaproteobacteria bacterium]